MNEFGHLTYRFTDLVPRWAGGPLSVDVVNNRTDPFDHVLFRVVIQCMKDDVGCPRLRVFERTKEGLCRSACTKS